jgi:hypothetical protein
MTRILTGVRQFHDDMEVLARGRREVFGYFVKRI